VGVVLLKPQVKVLADGKKEVTYKNCKPIVYKPIKSPVGLEGNVEALHPAFREKFKQFLSRLKEVLGKDYSVLITCTFRSFEEQEKLYKENPKTATKPGESPHNYGMAADFSVINNKTKVADTSKPEVIAKVEQVCKELGLFYGMWFKTFTKEPWHVQLAETPKWKEIYDKYKEV